MLPDGSMFRILDVKKNGDIKNKARKGSMKKEYNHCYAMIGRADIKWWQYHQGH